jgi:hypothetical protein
MNSSDHLATDWNSPAAAQQRAYHFIPLEDLALDALVAGVEER